MLDEGRRQSRIVIPGEKGEIHCDFAPFRTSSLTGDLLLRDFRINAMIWRIHAGMGPEDFSDPLGGREDLRAGRLVMCGEEVLYNDPLRVLKGARHCKTLQLLPDAGTVRAMHRAAGLLASVAAERLRKEAGLLLHDPLPATALRWLQCCGAAETVLGGWITSVDSGRLFDRLFSFGHRMGEACACEHGDFVRDALDEEFEEGVTRQAVLNLAAVMVGRPAEDVRNIALRLKLARASSQALQAYLGLPEGRWKELRDLRCGLRGRCWWVADLGADPVGCLLFMAGSRGEAQASRIISLAVEYAAAGTQRDLVDGDWLRRHLGMKPGPGIGAALRALRREEVAGRVSTARQAEAFLRNRFEKTD